MLQVDTYWCCQWILTDIVSGYLLMLSVDTYRCCQWILTDIVGGYFIMLSVDTYWCCGCPFSVCLSAKILPLLRTWIFWRCFHPWSFLWSSCPWNPPVEERSHWDYFNVIQYSPYHAVREITLYHANTYYDAGLLITLTCNKTNNTLSF